MPSACMLVASFVGAAGLTWNLPILALAVVTSTWARFVSELGVLDCRSTVIPAAGDLHESLSQPGLRELKQFPKVSQLFYHGPLIQRNDGGPGILIQIFCIWSLSFPHLTETKARTLDPVTDIFVEKIGTLQSFFFFSYYQNRTLGLGEVFWTFSLGGGFIFLKRVHSFITNLFTVCTRFWLRWRRMQRKPSWNPPEVELGVQGDQRETGT